MARINFYFYALFYLSLYKIYLSVFVANQYKIDLMFTGNRVPLHTYGQIQIKVINHDGLNETLMLTRLVEIVLEMVTTRGVNSDGK